MFLRKIRRKVKTVLWVVIIIFVALIFLEWGMEFTSTRRLTPRERGIIGIVNGREISSREYLNLVEYYRNQGISPWKCEMLAFNTLIEEILIHEKLEEQKIKLTDEEVVTAIKSNPPPALLEDTLFQTNGEFDYKKYHAILSDPANLRWLESYELMIRDQVPRQLLYHIVANTVRPTSIELIEAYTQQNLKLELEYVIIDSTRFDPEEKLLLEYYNTNKNEFLTPEVPIVKYVVFEVSPTLEDKIYIKEEVEEIVKMLKEGKSIDSLAMEYRYPLFDANLPRDSIVGPIKKENEYWIIKGNKKLTIPIRASDGTFTQVEERVLSFIEDAKSGFEEASKSYEVKVHKIEVTDELSIGELKLPWLDIETKDKIIGPIRGFNCFYVLQTLGITNPYIPEFSEIKEKIYHKYWYSKAKELANSLLEKIKKDNFKEVLSINGFKVMRKKFSSSDSSEALDLFLRASNMHEDEVAVIPVKNKIYIAHCLKREAPQQDSLQNLPPEFITKWMQEEGDRIYTAWLNKLKQEADIKDYRYKIH